MRNLYIGSIAAMLFSLCMQVSAEIEEVLVHASALRQQAGETVTPATVLGKDQIQNRLATNIADVLATTPGVNSSGFGPGAGRPVIRGHGAARVQTLQGGTDTFDAATVSPDHAVSSDPFSAEAIEVLRGPATLAHGSGAIGGVVNTVDHAIADRPVSGLSGRVMSGADNGNDGRYSVLAAQAGNGRWAANVDASVSDAGNIEIPGAASELANSAVDTRAGSAGFSHHSEQGYWGFAQERYETVYGVPVEEDVYIDLEQTRTRFAGEWEPASEYLDALRIKAVHSDYRHREIEDGETGTEFKVRGKALRVELQHHPVGNAAGVIGLHLRKRAFEAIGDEAFLPVSDSDAGALFIVEDLTLSDRASLELGLRVEREWHQAQGDRAQRFNLKSYSAGTRYDLTDTVVLAGSISHSERAPSAEELFANGVHVATHTFEIGDRGLSKETANHIDAALRWQGAHLYGSIDVFHTRFKDFVFAGTDDCNADGVADRVDENFDGSCTAVTSPAAAGHDGQLLVSRQRQRDAVYTGAEAELGYRMAIDNGHQIDLGLFADTVRARLDGGGAIPRIPARRIGAQIAYEAAVFDAGMSWVHARPARDLASLETPTAGWNRWDAYLNWRPAGPDTPWTLRLRGMNLANDEIRSHTSFIKDEVPAIGRHFGFALEYQLH